MNSAICHAVSPCSALSLSWEGPSLQAPPALWQVKRQSCEPIFRASLPNVCGTTVKPKHMLQLILISFSLSYYLMAMSLPPCQVPRGPHYFNSPCSNTGKCFSGAGQSAPSAHGLCNRGGKKTTKGLKTAEACWQHFSLPLTPSLGLTLYYWKVKSSTPGVNIASLQVCDECGRPLHRTC